MQENKRARAAACSTCRVRKRRCLPATEDPYGPCQLCQSTASPCSLVQGRATPLTPISQQSNASPEASHGSHVKHESLLPPRKILGDLVKLYFRLIHDGPHTLFHEPSLTANMSIDATPALLLLSICSLSARFSEDAIFQNVEPRLRGRPYAKAAMELLQQELIKPTLATVQACILLSQYVGGEGDVKAKHIYAGMAMLHSQAIRLWDVRVSAQVDIVTREVCQRTWLSVVITDRWTAADMSRISMSSVKREHNFSLLNEEAFIALQPGAREHSGHLTSPGQGLWAQMAKTIDIFGDISETIFRLGSTRSSTALRETKISQLTTSLDLWTKELPEKLIYSTENLEYFKSFGFGKTFLAMHIGYHHFRQLLYYPFLDACRRSNDEQDLRYVEICKENAMRVSDIANVAFQTSSCSLVYFIIGHILVVSSSVHLHTLLFSDLQEANLARDHLVSNFEILMQLKTYWPVIDTAVGRLRTFQDDCRKSMTDPFVLDNWMLKFLIEHSAVLDSERWPSIEQQSQTEVAMPLRPIALAELSVNSGMGSLSALVSVKNLSNDALVENALSWLLG